MACVGLSKALNSTARWAPRSSTRWTSTARAWSTASRIPATTGATTRGSRSSTSADRTTTSSSGGPRSTTRVSPSAPTSRSRSGAQIHLDGPGGSRASPGLLSGGRVLAGNVEGATDSQVLPPNVNGFKTDYIEASQLVYTLTTPGRLQRHHGRSPGITAQDLEEETASSASSRTRGSSRTSTCSRSRPSPSIPACT